MRYLLSSIMFLVLGGCATEGDRLPALGPLDTLASPAAQGSGEPELAVGDDGRVHLSWIEPVRDGVHALRFATLRDTTWTSPRTIVERPDFFINWADFPSIVALGGNRLAAHWLQRTGSATYAYGVRVALSSDGGGTWSAPIIPHQDTSAAEHGFVSLFPVRDSLGVVWLDGRSYATSAKDRAETMLMFAAIAPSGAVAPEQPIDGRICDCCQTSVVLVDGRPVVAYRDRSPEEIRDIYVARWTDTGWTAGAPVHNDGWKINACPVNGPAMTADGQRVSVAWFTGARDSARVYVAHSTDGGGTFAAPVRVDDGQPAGRVDLVTDGAGGVVVSWLEMAGEGGAEVRVRHVGAGDTPGPAQTVARTSGARASGFPRMIVAGGHLVLVWTEAGSPARVRTARLRLGGAR